MSGKIIMPGAPQQHTRQATKEETDLFNWFMASGLYATLARAAKAGKHPVIVIAGTTGDMFVSPTSDVEASPATCVACHNHGEIVIRLGFVRVVPARTEDGQEVSAGPCEFCAAVTEPQAAKTAANGAERH